MERHLLHEVQHFKITMALSASNFKFDFILFYCQLRCATQLNLSLTKLHLLLRKRETQAYLYHLALWGPVLLWPSGLLCGMKIIFFLCLLSATWKVEYLSIQQIILVNGQSFGQQMTVDNLPNQQIHQQQQQQSNVPPMQSQLTVPVASTLDAASPASSSPSPSPSSPASGSSSSSSTSTFSASLVASSMLATTKEQSGPSQMQPMQLTERQMMRSSIVATPLPLNIATSQGKVGPQQSNFGLKVNQYSNNNAAPSVHSPIMNGREDFTTFIAPSQPWSGPHSMAQQANGPFLSPPPSQINTPPWPAFGSNGGAASAQTPGPREGQLNYDLIKAVQLAEAQKQAAWKTYNLAQCLTPEKPLGGLDLPVIGAVTRQPKMCSDANRRYLRYHSSTWSMGCCRIDSNLDSYDISKAQCCLVGGSRCEANGIPCCNQQSCCNGKCRMTSGFFSDENLSLAIPYYGHPKSGRNVVPLNYAEYELCSDLRHRYYYSFSQLHESYFGCCMQPPSSSQMASKLCCLLARSACDGGIACCNNAPCTNGKCPIESGDLTWPSLFNVTCIASASVVSQQINGQQQQQQQLMVRLIHDPLIQLADPIYKYFFMATLSNGQQMHAACTDLNVSSFFNGSPSYSKQCCLMAGSPCSPLINCCRGVPCCNGRCVKQAGSLKSRTGYSITFNECNEKD